MIARRSIRRRGVGGFSLVEMVMVIVLFGILAVIAAPLLNGGFKSYFGGKDITETDWQARIALERMTRELRTMRSPADLTITSAADIIFNDVDGTSIRYCLGTVGGCPGAAGELTRNSQPLATGISALSFTFLDKSRTATGTAANVYYITVGFTATQNSVIKTFQATVSPRNFP